VVNVKADLKKRQNVGTELDSFGSGQGIGSRFCEYGNEPLVFVWWVRLCSDIQHDCKEGEDKRCMFQRTVHIRIKEVHRDVAPQWRTDRGVGLVWGLKPPPKFRRPSKIEPNSTRLWKTLKIPEFRTPAPPRCSEEGSKILKLPPVRNCFTLSVTNKLVVIINSLKVPKIEKMLLYEMKFPVPSYSCLQNLWLGVYCPQIPVLSVLNWICWTTPPTPPNKIPGYATIVRTVPQNTLLVCHTALSVTCHDAC